MPKKKSLKTQKDGNEKPTVEAEQTSIRVKKPKDEIDEIFASRKRKKHGQEKVDKHSETEDLKPKKMKKKKKDRGLKDNDLDEPSQPRRRTNDGLAIFSEEELGINKTDAGGTPLCPFDCSCCF